jgi:hypothetical protein
VDYRNCWPIPAILRVMPQPSVSTWKTAPKTWAEEQAHRAALEIRRLRGKRSTQWLSNRTAELGSEVTRSVISDLEVGRRRYLTTAELIVIALALDTAPIALLYPPPYLDKVQAFPPRGDGGPVDVTKVWAVQWFSGLANGVDADGTGNLIQLDLPFGMNMGRNLLALTRARRAQRLDEMRIEKTRELGWMKANNTGSEKEIDDLEKDIDDLGKGIDELWSLGGRDLAAERFEQLTKRPGGDSDGG